MSEAREGEGVTAVSMGRKRRVGVIADDVRCCAPCLYSVIVQTLDRDRCTLVLVDYQAKLMPAIHDASEVLADAVLLADAARLLGIRVVGTEQSPASLGRNVPAIRARCDVTVAKTRFDACADGLLAELQSLASPEPRSSIESQVVIAGCEAHVCLMQTALGVLRAGRALWVVESACGSRRVSDHRLAMQRLRAAGATLASPEMAIFEWLRGSDHPKFRRVLEQVKARPLGAAPDASLTGG
jgi:nicotinamidase-related amidase